ncbi:phosphopentomutase [Periplaneta americana]|uniref:phosphopentomutase n=1 Tax=Periplaneta americana TaxID=6978 RepID=UPI0037E73C61
MNTEVPLMDDKELDEKIKEWLDWDKNERTRAEIQSLCLSKEVEKLKKLLLSRMKFGTAGLRGRMGAGYSQMNDLVIIQTAQGLTIHLEETVKDVAYNNGVVIGYDGRHNSKRWAELTAAILLNRGIPVYLFSKVCPTPYVPFALLHYKCAAGVMVTASHNPKEDNGFKVYWQNGAQIISPHDKDIQKNIENNLCPWEMSWDISVLRSSKHLIDPLEEANLYYMQALKQDILDPKINANCDIKFTYSAMHGVGYPYMAEAFKTANFKPFIIVEEQKDPDPKFPTVKFPNPEEGKSALDLSIKTANTNNSTIILANDPDADRLAVAEKQSKGDNEWYVFNGNELGGLLGWWCWYSYCQQNSKEDASNCYMMSSTVSSKILKTMAAVEGFNFIETLTGFKWMGNKTAELQAENKKVLFAYEEAIGFMCGSAVLDKDGISAGVRAAELVAFLSKNGMSLMDKLKDLFSTYGYHISNNSYFLCYEQEVIEHLFQRLRNFTGKPNTYPQSLLNGKYEIVSVRDLTTGHDSSQADKKAILPVSRSSQMITFAFKNGLVATLRTSGTEPKIKYYTELCAPATEKCVEISLLIFVEAEHV